MVFVSGIAHPKKVGVRTFFYLLVGSKSYIIHTWDPPYNFSPDLR